jgi:hypothetical protein
MAYDTYRVMKINRIFHGIKIGRNSLDFLRGFKGVRKGRESLE